MNITDDAINARTAEPEISLVSSYIRKILLEHPSFYGSTRINWQGGKAVNMNIERSVMLKKAKV